MISRISKFQEEPNLSKNLLKSRSRYFESPYIVKRNISDN